MLANELPWVVYEGSGSRGPFPISSGGTPISFAESSHIQVTRIIDGVSEVLVNGTHYQLSASSALPDLNDIFRTVTAASVTLKLTEDVLEEDEYLIIERIAPASQDLSYAQAGGFSSSANERNLDAIMRVIQQLVNKSNRTVTTNPLDPSGVLVVPTAAARANKFVAFDDDGNIVAAGGEAGTGDLISSNNLSELTDPAAARTNLGLGSAALLATTAVFLVANNLSEGNATAMRSNLGVYSIAQTDQAIEDYISTVMTPVVQADTLTAAQALLFGASNTFAAAITDPLITIRDARVSAGDMQYDLTIGEGSGTEFPDFAVWGAFSQTKAIARSLVLSEFNDGVDLWFRTALGTRDTPTAHTVTTSPYLAVRMYYTPYDGTGNWMTSDANSHYSASAAYKGIGAEINYWLMATPTQNARAVSIVLSTANATQTPIDRVAVKHDGKCIFYGNAYEVSGISYPHAPGNIHESRMPISGLNFFDYSPPASNTFIAGDLQLASANKALAIMSLASPLQEGMLLGINRTDVELVLYRRWGATTDYKFMAVVLNSGLMALGYSTSGREALRVVPRAAATTSLTVTAGDGSNNTKLELTSSDTDASLALEAKGAGVVKINARPLFRASLNAAQTGIASTVATLVTFDTEAFDVGAYYNNSTYRWTPPAGPVRLSLGLYMSGLTAATLASCTIYKNGAVIARGQISADASGVAVPVCSVSDVANGSDYYEAYATGTSAGTVTVAAAAPTRFCGEQC